MGLVGLGRKHLCVLAFIEILLFFLFIEICWGSNYEVKVLPDLIPPGLT